MKTEPKFTLLHRSLHWTMTLAMSILFITGFLRMYWMGKAAVYDAVSTQFAEVTRQQSNAIYKILRDPMWEWHVIFAWVMILAFVVRIIYIWVKGNRFPNPFAKETPRSEKIKGLTYVYFYVFVLAQAITGICLYFDLFSDYKNSIESFHKFAIWLFPIFILLHFMGILRAELTDKRGIVSKMIGGDREMTQ